MYFTEQLYYDTSVFEDEQKIKGKLLKKKPLKIQVLIVRLQNPNLIEVVETKELYRLDAHESDLYVIGFAKSILEAYDEIEKLAKRTISHYASMDKKYLIKELDIHAAGY